MPGPAPKPTALKILEGNPGKRALNDREPSYPTAMTNAKPPAFLNRDGKKYWNETAPLLIAQGVLTEVDLASFALVCQAWGRYVDVEKKLAKMSLVIKTTNGNIIQNPLLAVANRAFDQYRAMATEFGLTPSSRSRIVVAAKQPEADPLEAMLSGKNGD
jgi:P27 family predicted phage terminase small subunit